MDETSATPLERALGLEIQNEARRQGLTHKAIQQIAGINDKSFRRYFVTGERHIPANEAQRVADALGVPLSTLMARAERAEAARAVEGMDLSPRERAELQAAIDHRLSEPHTEHPTRNSHTG